ncbi:MAG TPA: D-2-hydroxyacid dehydrogenase [Candidatus Latescibacteria bacterium]|nr:D-2-hydroxyacid dehydrogenase [Candidatus Handelsmanbacteria bacterium]HIL08760.1 D-2-hydroxyacid dehydrogenase [Candidatus Latescibacterota bacterium]
MKVLVQTLSYRPNNFLKDIEGVEYVIASTDEEAIRVAADIDATINICSATFIEAAPKLRWIQMLSTGVNGVPFDLLRERGIALTNAGAYGPNMADHTMAFMLMLSRQIPQILRRQAKERWLKKDTPIPDPGELDGQTLLIIGLGGIGLETAKRAAAFGMRIIATRRHVDRPAPDYVHELHPIEALGDLLPRANWINVSVPYTADTADLIGDREFDLMRDGVHMLCLARGGIINTDALLRALDSGKVAGAGLDVTDPEPLPDDHPLWDYPNVIITPHSSGQSEAAHRRLGELVADNAQRFLLRQPLRNIVDLELRY